MKLSDIQKRIEAYLKVVGDKEIDNIRIRTDNVDCTLQTISSIHIIYREDLATIIING